MNKKSDTTERRLSATEASRSFSDVLDEIEKGRRFVIHRRGRDICVMTPPVTHGRSASEARALLRGRPPVHLDDRFGSDLLDIVATELADDESSWDS